MSEEEESHKRQHLDDSDMIAEADLSSASSPQSARKVPAKKAAKQKAQAAAASAAQQHDEGLLLSSKEDDDEEAEEVNMDPEDEEEEEEKSHVQQQHYQQQPHNSSSLNSNNRSGLQSMKGKKGPETFEAELFAGTTILNYMRENPTKSAEEVTVHLKEQLDLHFKQEFILRAAAQRKRLVEVFALEIYDAAKRVTQGDATQEALEKVKYLDTKYPEQVKLTLVELGNLLVQRLEAAQHAQKEAGIAL